MSDNFSALRQADQAAMLEALQQTAAGEDVGARVRLGSSAETPPELLYYLTTDSSVLVRAAVALNQSAPGKADTYLTSDPDERVRMVLAQKLTTLLPSLSGDDQARLAQQAWTNLAVLVRDEADRVRQTVADLVKDLAEAPHGLVLELAHDPVLDVSDPVLRLSPVLTDEDLVSLLGSTPAAHTARSIAQRAALTAPICDAIAQSADNGAIRALLGNHSAAIREATLEGLVTRATAHRDWHEPLVRRPILSPRAALSLSGMISDRLIGVLATRPDLPGRLVSDLREKLEQRLAQGAPAAQPGGMQWGEAKPQPRERWPSERSVLDAIRAGEMERATIMLALAADVPVAAVEHAAQLRSGRAAVSLLWKAGFSMRTAGPVQASVFGLAPGAALAASAEGAFPLSEAEMTAQVELLTRAVA
jgi:uncharacterized protein (DUF2336 family)